MKYIPYIVLMLAAVLIISVSAKAFGKKDVTSTDVKVNEDNLSFPANQYLIFADEIHSNLYYEGALDWNATNDEKAASDVLKKMQNDDDVYYLIKTFGERKQYGFLDMPTTNNMNLTEFVAKELPGHKFMINALYAARNMKFRW